MSCCEMGSLVLQPWSYESPTIGTTLIVQTDGFVIISCAKYEKCTNPSG
jgi:hypothetical protein